MKNFLLFAFVILVGWKANAQIGPQPPVIKNPEGVHCELRFTDGKAQFQQGETIRVTLAFSSNKPDAYRLNTFFQPPPSLLSLGNFEASPGEGVSRPYAELPPPQMIAIAGYVPTPVLLSSKPTEITVDLNEYLRFDHPGSYTLSVKTNRVFDKTPSNRSTLLFAPGGYEIDSNTLPLEIVPIDPEWAARQVQAQRALWKQSHQEWQPIPVAPSFRYLPTREAMDAVTERLAAGERPRSSEDEARFWRISLLGFPDRPWLINEMRRVVAKPDTPVTQGLLEDLAMLRTLEQQKKGVTAEPIPAPTNPSPKPQFFQSSFDVLQRKLLSEEWRRTQIFLPTKRHRARAMTIHSLLELAWLNQIEFEPTDAAKIHRLEKLVPSIYSDLPPLPQEYLLLETDWPHIKSPAMIAPLLRLWDSLPLRSEGYSISADNVLKRILEIAPVEGRKKARLKMASARHRVSVKPVPTLPDLTLPQFDKMWLQRLTKNERIRTRSQLSSDATLRLRFKAR